MQTNKKKMLYIMGIDWTWIYQRPQIIAECLCNDFDVTVAYPVKIWDRNTDKKINEYKSVIRHLKLWVFPFQGKCDLIGKLSDVYISKVMKKCYRYEYVYIDYPIYINYIPDDYNGFIIYDCIDDYEQMCSNEYMRNKVIYAERILIQRSHFIFASSQRLVEKIEKISQDKKITLVRNGAEYNKIYNPKETEDKQQYHIGYVGTIAEWFDKKLIIHSAERHAEITYHLIGPSLEEERNHFDRIIFEGIVEHSKLYSYVKHYDCLLMPFVVNDVVKAVDPVKLYEYVTFGKCIVSVYYEELEHFKDYVYFYTTHEEYERLMEYLISNGFPTKYNSEQQRAFLMENGWDQRYKLIMNQINSKEEIKGK